MLYINHAQLVHVSQEQDFYHNVIDIFGKIVW